MTDIHCHILPGVDDGSEDFDESCNMLHIAASSGTECIVMTPHITVDEGHFDKKENLIAVFERFYSEYCEEDIDIRFGAENRFVSPLEDNVYPITLSGSRYLLTEFDFRENKKKMIEIVGSITSRGYVPVIAHPERYLAVHHDYTLVYRLIENGCLLQVNAGSMLGEFGKMPYEISNRLVSDRIAFCAASDSHGVYHRNPDMSEAYEHVYLNYSRHRAECMFYENPALIVENKAVRT